MDLFSEIVEALESNQSVVLATIVGPSDAAATLLGRRLLARADGATFGGLGAPTLDARALREGNRLAAATPPAELFRWELTSDEAAAVGLAAGNTLEVFVEAIAPPQTLLIVGGGHIALPLARLGRMLGFQVTVLDDRPEFASRERFPDADQVIAGSYKVELARLSVGPTTYVVLVTRGHVTDEEALREVISSSAAYLGMIGSRRRVGGVLQRMAESGVPQADVERVYSPIGLDIGAETPEEIALSIMAEVVYVRRRGERHPSSMSYLKQPAGQDHP